jgi:hypothetical protein
MIEQKWRVRLGAVAELDFANILAWTTENFGARQSRIYRDTRVRAIGELANGPDVAGSNVTRSCRASARSILAGAAGADVISSCTGSAKGKSLKSAISSMTRWTSSSAPLRGSIAAEGSPRIGRISTERRSRSCASHQSASCSENSAIRPKVFGRTLRKNLAARDAAKIRTAERSHEGISRSR